MLRWTKKTQGGEINIYLLIFLCSLFLLSANSSLSLAAEEKYPNRPITVVQSWGPGCTSDVGGRILYERMSEDLGQPLVSAFKPGGGGTLGASFVAKAKPDGYTVMVGVTGNLVFRPVMQKLDYSMDDFACLGIFASSPLMLAVKPDARWKTLKEFVDEAKSADKMLVSTFGKMTTSDFVLQRFAQYAKINLINVPYKSSAAALTALLGGHADLAIVGSSGGLRDSGSIRVLAFAGEQRLEDFPDIPTIKEFGYPVANVSSMCFCFPKGTPQQIIDRFSAAQKRAMDKYSEDIKENLRKVELQASFGTTPEDTKRENKKTEKMFLEWKKELGLE